MEDPNGIARFKGVLEGIIKETNRCNIPGCTRYVSPVWNDVCNEHEIERTDLYRGPNREIWLVVTQIFFTTDERQFTTDTCFTPAHSYDEAWQRAYAAIRRKWDMDTINTLRAIVVEKAPIYGDWTIDGADFHMTLRLDRDVIYGDENE